MGVVAVGLSGLCAIVPGVFRRQLAVADRLLAIGLASIPGVLLGLALLPSNSVAGFCAVTGVYAVTVLSGAMAGDSVLEAWSRKAIREVQQKADSADLTGDSGLLEGVNPEQHDWPIPVVVRQQNADGGASLMATLTNPSSGDLSEAILHPSENSETTQWMSRQQTLNSETAEGGCRVEFEAQQKVAVVHIPFSPAFSVAPCFECELLDDTELKIKISARHRFGVRIELTRQGGLVDSQSVSLGWYAVAEVDGVALSRSAA